MKVPPAAVIAFALSAIACDPPPLPFQNPTEPRPPASNTRSVNGRVIEQDSQGIEKGPIEGATVSIGASSTTTNANGEFRLTYEFVAGTQEICAVAEGFDRGCQFPGPNVLIKLFRKSG